jgi:hypothetical protein
VVVNELLARFLDEISPPAPRPGSRHQTKQWRN